jgi:hypothetical protein
MTVCIRQGMWSPPPHNFKRSNSWSLTGGGDKVDSGIGLSYRPARLHRLAVGYDNPMPESNTVFPPSGTYKFGYRVTGQVRVFNDDISVYYPPRLFPS